MARYKREKNKFWQLPLFKDRRGNLCPIDKDDLPFAPKRIYFLYEVSGGRGGHAHQKEKEIFVCISGKFRGRVHNGKQWRSFQFFRPGQALFTPEMTWHEFDQFSPGAVMLALSSVPFDGKKGYIMDFEKFLTLCRKKSS